MSTQSIITVKQFTGPDRMAHTCTAPQPSAHNLLNAKTVHCGSAHDPQSSCTAAQSSSIKSEMIGSSSLTKIFPFDLQKRSPYSNPESVVSRISQAELSDPILSSSSTFCTSMFSPFQTNSESCRQKGALPFLPHPSKCDGQQNSAGPSSSSSSLLFSADLSNGGHDGAEHLHDVKDFLNLSEDISEGSFHGESNTMAFSEQMEFHFLFEP